MSVYVCFFVCLAFAEVDTNYTKRRLLMERQQIHLLVCEEEQSLARAERNSFIPSATKKLAGCQLLAKSNLTSIRNQLFMSNTVWR